MGQFLTLELGLWFSPMADGGDVSLWTFTDLKPLGRNGYTRQSSRSRPSQGFRALSKVYLGFTSRWKLVSMVAAVRSVIWPLRARRVQKKRTPANYLFHSPQSSQRRLQAHHQKALGHPHHRHDVPLVLKALKLCP